MRRWTSVSAAFVFGALVASGGWAWYSFKRQAELAAIHVTALHFEANLGVQILEYLDSDDPLTARRLSFAASNMVAGFSRDMAVWDREFPRLNISQRYAAESERFDQIIQERQRGSITNAAAEMIPTDFHP
jgi:hypothetical protein